MKKKRSFAAAIIMLLLAFTLVPTAVWAAWSYQYYQPDIAAIDTLSDSRGLKASKSDACEPMDDWPFVLEWDHYNGNRSIKILKLENKDLYGELKDLLSSLPSLANLDLSGNSLSGEITLANPELATLDLSDNQFTRADLSSLGKLSSLNLSGNPLQEVRLPGKRIIRTASEPHSGGTVSHLEQLSLHGAMSLEAKPASGYGFVKWKSAIDAEPSVAASLKIDPTTNPISFTLPENTAIEMTAVFAPLHSITVTTEGNGTAAPSGLTEVTEGKDAAFTFTPAKGWKIKSVKADGKELGALQGYTFYNVIQDHVLHVVFEKKQVQSAAQTDKGSDKSDPPDQSDSPATGDAFPIYFWLALALLSAAAMTGILVMRKAGR